MWVCGVGVGAGVELPPHPATTATAAAAPERAMKLRRVRALSMSSVNFLSTRYLSCLKDQATPVQSTRITRYLSNAAHCGSDCYIPIPLECPVQRKWHIVSITRLPANGTTRAESEWIFGDCECVALREHTTPGLFPVKVMTSEDGNGPSRLRSRKAVFYRGKAARRCTRVCIAIGNPV